MTEGTPQKTLFDLALYLVACSRLAVDENLGMASFRLIEGASRLIAASEELGIEPDPFLVAELPKIDEEKLRSMHDVPGYIAALDEIQARFVAEAKRRNSEET